MVSKWLLTGAGGMLGQEVLLWAQAQPHIEVVALDRQALDVCDALAVERAVAQYQPNVIIHCAAYTKVDLAEKERELCFQVNALGSAHVARAAEMIGAELVSFSTDYVFDGGKGESYREEDAPNPLNVYGESKWAGEQEVLNHCSRAYVLRVSWLCGPFGPNFIKAILKKAEQEPVLKVVSDQVAVPTFTFDVIKALSVLLAQRAYGVYHMVSQGQCSWYDFACEIVRRKTLPCEVIPIESRVLNQAAKRPQFSLLSGQKLQSLLGEDIMPEWTNSLDAYLNNMR